MKNQLIGLAAGILICTATVMADTFPNTLWVGNDGTAAAPILNTTTAGVVLRQIDNTAAVGLAIDSNKLYVNSTTSGGNIYNLDTLNPVDTFSLPNPSFDLTFSGGFLWAASFSTGTIDKVDPATGALAGGFAVDFIPIGVTTDGAGGFWVSGFGAAGQVLRHFNASFQPDADIDTSDIVDGLGGLGFDPRDNTLFIGSLGKVYHYDTIGTGHDLGFFELRDPNQFVDGLEFDAAAPVPEPTSIVLLGTLTLAVAGMRRRLNVRR